MPQVFQTNSRAVLRQLKAHQRPVHVARFSPDKLHVLSGSDDATVRGSCPAERETWSPLQVDRLNIRRRLASNHASALTKVSCGLTHRHISCSCVIGRVAAQVRFWDVTQGQQVSRLTGHTDYVRAGAVSPLDMNVWATGGFESHPLRCSVPRYEAVCAGLNATWLTQRMLNAGGYDHVCKIWDVRSKAATLSLDHGAPIEALTYFPSGVRLCSHAYPCRCWTC